MEKVANIEYAERVAKIYGNKIEINADTLYRGRCRLLANIMSNCVANEYNFDRTELVYEEDGEYKKIESYGMLSEAQLLALLITMRINNLNLYHVFHIEKTNNITVGLYDIGIDDRYIRFTTPENNGWILDGLIKKYHNNKTSMKNSVAIMDIDGVDVNLIVKLINRRDTVLRVNKAILDGENINILESESACAVITEDRLYLVEYEDNIAYKQLLASLKSELKDSILEMHNVIVI